MKFPDYQDKVAEEISTALDSHDGVVSYELIENLKYTEMFIKESMRWYGSVVIEKKNETNNY